MSFKYKEEFEKFYNYLETKFPSGCFYDKEGNIPINKEEVFRINIQNVDELKEIPDFSEFKNLQSLSIIHCYIEKISNLEKLTQLTYLDLSFNCISKIENLDNLIQLQTLNLQDNRVISKIENLDNCKDLKKLYLQQNELSKIENLDNLTQLQILDLSRNSISKIENLDNNKNLEVLDLNTNSIEIIENLNFRTIQNPKHLKELNISYNPLKYNKIPFFNLQETRLSLENHNYNYDNADNYKEYLKKLYFNYLKDFNLEIKKDDILKNNLALNDIGIPIYQIEHTKEIFLNDLGLKKIPLCLKDFRYITKLNLSNNDIETIDNINEVSNGILENLNLSNNLLTDIKPLNNINFHFLKELNISYNEIPEIKLDNSIFLSKLYANNNKIKDLDLSNNEIKYLNLSNNGIESLEFIKDIPKLNHLTINNNFIQNMKPLIYNKKLEFISIKGNEIKKIIPLELFKNLKNVIVDFEKLDYCKYSVEYFAELKINNNLKSEEPFKKYLKEKENKLTKRKKLHQKIKNNKFKKEKQQIYSFKKDLNNNNLLNNKNDETINFGY